ncbi:hypothetical protein F2Q70_00001108 [Brassica cretica]|uniref:Uncharacterized protein n=1 Tax=Brassica cretica TaxID=69181 RepID=A0A8S9IS48_BRACR|nr:hypothetical protein F2Q70_00001108 [Brassica cretica]
MACIAVVLLLTDDYQKSQVRLSVDAELFCLADIPTVVVFLSSPASLPSGQGSGAVVRTIVLRWWCSGHRRSLRRQLLVSKTGSLVLGWRALVSEISTFDSSRFLTTNEKQIHQESILDLNELPGSGGYSLLVVSPCRWVQGSLWLGGVAVKLMSLPSSSFPVTASVASISERLVDVAGYQLLVSPNKSGCGLDVEVLVVPVRGLQALVRWFRHFGAAPLSSAASSEFSLVSLLFAGGRALW